MIDIDTYLEQAYEQRRAQIERQKELNELTAQRDALNEQIAVIGNLDRWDHCLPKWQADLMDEIQSHVTSRIALQGMEEGAPND